MTPSLEKSPNMCVVGRGYLARYIGQDSWHVIPHPNVQVDYPVVVNERASKHKIKAVRQVKNIVVVNDRLRYAVQGHAESLTSLNMDDFSLKALGWSYVVNVVTRPDDVEGVWVDTGRAMAYARLASGVMFRRRALFETVYEACTLYIPKALFQYIVSSSRRRFDCWQSQHWTALAFNKHVWLVTKNCALDVGFPNEREGEKLGRDFSSRDLIQKLRHRVEEVVIVTPNFNVHSVESGAVGLCVRRADLLSALHPHHRTQILFNAHYLWVRYCCRDSTVVAVPLVQRRVIC